MDTTTRLLKDIKIDDSEIEGGVKSLLPQGLLAQGATGVLEVAGYTLANSGIPFVELAGKLI